MPSSEGYKTAWEKFKIEYGQNKTVANEIIKIATVKGVNYEKVEAFYGQLSENFDALKTLGEE